MRHMGHGSWVKGLVGHMGHKSLSLTHLQLCLQVCQIRRNRIGQNNGLVNLHWLDYCFVLFYFTLLLIYGCRGVYYVCKSPLRQNLWVAMVSVVRNSFTLYVLLQIQSLLNFLRISILSDYTKTVLHFLHKRLNFVVHQKR